MPRSKEKTQVHYPTLIREARATWRTVPEIAEDYDLTVNYTRWLLEHGKVEALMLDGAYRINPASMDAFFAARHKQPQ